MNELELLAVVKIAEKLKVNTRHNWTEKDRKESVADHSWRTALMAMLLTGVEEFKDVDMNRVIRMCLIHDLGEAFTGDVPAFLKTKVNEKIEDAIFDEWVTGFPSPNREEWQKLLAEMNAQETVESQIYKALDKLEAVIAHNEADIDTWLPLEYDLQYSYAVEKTKFSPYLTKVRKVVDDWTTRKIRESEEHGRYRKTE